MFGSGVRGLVLAFSKGKKTKLFVVVHLLVAFFLMLPFQEHSQLAKAAAATPSGSWQKAGDRPGQQKLAEGYIFQQWLCFMLVAPFTLVLSSYKAIL